MLVWYLALDTCCLKVSSVGVKCEAGLSVVEAREYRSWPSKKEFNAFIPYRLRTNELTEETSINIIFLYAKYCERLIAIFYQVLYFRVGDTPSYLI